MHHLVDTFEVGKHCPQQLEIRQRMYRREGQKHAPPKKKQIDPKKEGGHTHTHTYALTPYVKASWKGYVW